MADAEDSDEDGTSEETIKKSRLKCTILKLLHDNLKSEHGSRIKNVTVNKLNNSFSKQYCSPKFANLGFGKFKEFLAGTCELKIIQGDKGADEILVLLVDSIKDEVSWLTKCGFPPLEPNKEPFSEQKPTADPIFVASCSVNVLSQEANKTHGTASATSSSTSVWSQQGKRDDQVDYGNKYSRSTQFRSGLNYGKPLDNKKSRVALSDGTRGDDSKQAKDELISTCPSDVNYSQIVNPPKGSHSSRMDNTRRIVRTGNNETKISLDPSHNSQKGSPGAETAPQAPVIGTATRKKIPQKSLTQEIKPIIMAKSKRRKNQSKDSTGSNEQNIGTVIKENTQKEVSTTTTKEVHLGSSKIKMPTQIPKATELTKTCTPVTTVVEIENNLSQQQSKENYPPPRFDNKEENFKIIVRLLYKVGLQRFRVIFKQIHPNWSNTPNDAKELKKGKLKFGPREQDLQKLFNAGNIEDWDITLISKVLLYSKLCEHELSTNPKYISYTQNIDSIRNIRNNLVGHAPKPGLDEAEFQCNVKEISESLKGLGVSEEEVNESIKDHLRDDALKYYDLFNREEKLLESMQVRIGKLEGEVKSIREALEDNKISPEKASEKIEKLHLPKWDEWIRFRKAMNNLDTDANQLILISDRSLDGNELKDYSVLGRIQWRVVLDLDPNSEEGGLLAAFKKCKGRGALNIQHTPTSIGNQLTRPKNIEPHQTQWIFVNGRYQDECNEPKQTAGDWADNYGGAISRFIDFCITKFDNRKPTVCLILPLQEPGRAIAVEVLKMLSMFLHPIGSQYSYVCLNEDLNSSAFKMLSSFHFSSHYLRFGLLTLLGTPEGKYCLPSSQDGCPVPIEEREYLYLQGYLEPLYIGCQRIPNGLSKEELNKLKCREEDKFVSGNPISFLSLHFTHDAKREISREIYDHVRQELSTLCYTKVEEICHSPGTGGTTIARRLLWDLHHVYPCAIANISHISTFSVLESEAHIFLTDLAQRIDFLHELCDKPPVILIDGKSFMVDALVAQLERKLTTMKGKAILLSCVRPREDVKSMKDKDCCHIVNSNLEDSLADLNEFQEKYRKYEDVDLSDATRVFHFPLLALMKDFHPKLREIVTESLEILKTTGYEYEVVITVAFILIYAEQPTPAPLLFEMFKEHFDKSWNQNNDGSSQIVRSYADIKSLFSGNLLNLMINKKSTNKRRWVQQEEEFEGYTLQHPQVAKFVLEHAERPLHSIVRDFLSKPIFSNSDFRFLISDLFIYNKGQDRHASFSYLMTQLRKEASPQVAGKIFCSVAEKTDDAIFFSNAARFYVYVISPPDFRQAEQLIDRALKVNQITDNRRKRVYDTLGYIRKVKLKRQLTAKSAEFKTADEIAIPAGETIEAFRKAKDDGFPNPLVGEFEVWLDCLEWIIKHICHDNTRRAVVFITCEGPVLFRFAIRTCYDLLHEIEEIINNTERLFDPKRTQELASICRERLFTMLERTRSQTGRKGIEYFNLLTDLKSLTSKGGSKESANEFKKIAVLQKIRNNRKLELLPRKVIALLVDLLKDIVSVDREYKYTLDLLRVGSIPSENTLNLDEALQLAQTWAKQPVSQYSAYPMLFSYITCFVKILDGKAIADYRPVYEKALKASRDRSEGSCSRHTAQYYLVQCRSENSMTQLVTKSQLESLYHGQVQSDPSSEVQITDEFLKTHGRTLLRICEGRIFVDKVRRGNTFKKDPYIMTLSGNLRIYTPRTAIRVYRDFEEGDRVSFVVSFSMVGPRAHGIVSKTEE